MSVGPLYPDERIAQLADEMAMRHVKHKRLLPLHRRWFVTSIASRLRVIRDEYERRVMHANREIATLRLIARSAISSTIRMRDRIAELEEQNTKLTFALYETTCGAQSAQTFDMEVKPLIALVGDTVGQEPEQ